MQCDKLPLLREMILNECDISNSKEWIEHLKECPLCQREMECLTKSLLIYKQFNNCTCDKFSNLDIWEKLESRINKKQLDKFYSWKNISMAAAIAGLLIGLSSWWFFSSAPFNQNLEIPSNYVVKTISPNKPFGSASAQTRVLWTNKRFNLSIENSEEDNYRKIAIGMDLPNQFSEMVPNNLLDKKNPITVFNSF